MSDTALHLANVGKSFGGVPALAPMGLSVPRGDFIALLGPSGCGKSTLLRIVAGLVPADPGGLVEVLGRRQAGPSDEVGVVFQTHNMLPWLTLEANLRLAAEVRGMAKTEITERVEALLPVLRLARSRHLYPHELSGGMRQRAALGQILILRPQILLLDEPFGALDALTRDQLNVELLRLWQDIRITVLLVTHSIVEAVFLADRVLVLSDRPGRVVQDVRIDLPRPRDPRTTRRLAAFSDAVSQLSRLMGVEDESP